MAEETLRDELERLRGEVGALRAQQAALAALVGARGRVPRRRGGRGRRLFATGIATLLATLLPLSLLATSPFTDLNAGSVHNPDIEAIYAARISTGCVADLQYCPNDFVTREQMASFLARTAGLGTNKPVVNAARLGGRSGDDLVRVARAVGLNRTDVLPTTPAIVTAVYNTTDPALTVYQPLATVALTAPGGGFVLVAASMQAMTEPRVQLAVRLREPGSGAASPVLASGGSALILGSLAPTFVFPVGAGDHTVVLEAAAFDGSLAGGNAIASNAVVTAVYVPFGATATAELGAP